MNDRKKHLSMKVEILAVALIPLLLLTIALAIYSSSALQTSMRTESLEGLRNICQSLSAAYDSLDSGDYALVGNDLKKGNYDITKNQEMLDSFSDSSDVEVTVIYGDTRYATSAQDQATGEKLTGTKIADEVYSSVVGQGQDYSSTDLVIGGENYYAYYTPLKNSNGETVGAVFAGKSTATINSIIKEKIVNGCILALVLFVIVGIIAAVVATRIGNAVRKTENVLDTIAQGELNVTVDDKLLRRSDELGAMCHAVKELIDKLKTILGNVQQSSKVLSESNRDLHQFASQTSTTVSDVKHAVNDISHGAVSQAEDIDNATMSVNEMGVSIEKIVKKVETLHETSEEMEHAKSDAESIISELSESSEHTYEAVKKIEDQVNLTDESVTRIQDAVTLISSIAEETNLLSLNASIEAARAGEAGKGFAVVATEIQKLAEESNNTAVSIAEIIKNLSNESQNTVEAMKSVKELIDEQQDKLKETRNRFQAVSEGIHSSREEINDIHNDSETCDKARVKVTDVIQNLSAVAEQNAASTEQTAASMAQLNDTVSVLASKADELGGLAHELEDDMSYFKVG